MIEDSSEVELTRTNLQLSKYQHTPTLTQIHSFFEDKVFNSSDPIVVALDGRWGEGKTYFWKTEIVPKFPTSKLIYVSVFGASSIQEVRERVIFEILRSSFTTAGKTIQKTLNTESGFMRRNKAASFLLSKLSSLRNRIPELYRALVPTGISVQLFEEDFLKSDLIICIDDLERVSESLGVEHLLGYISELKEKWKIKVVIIYNHERMDDKSDTFAKLQEKVIDKRLIFAPQIRETLSKIFNSNDQIHFDEAFIDTLAHRCNLLGLRNLRLLQKINSYYQECVQCFEGSVSKEFRQELLSSLFLFTWAKFCPADAKNISLSSLAGLTSFRSSLDDEDTMSDEKKLLSDYGYAYTSELDLTLMQLVDSDVLNTTILQTEFAKFSQDASEKQMMGKYKNIWHTLYHGSLRDNSDEFCNSLANFLHEHIKSFPISNFDESLCVLVDLGKADVANELMAEFRKQRQGEVFNTDFLFDPIEYSELAKFIEDSKHNVELDNRDIGTVVESILKDQYPSTVDSKSISKFSADEFVDYFMSVEQERLTVKLRSLANLATKIGITELGILRNTIFEAANKISQTSVINRRRMNSMGLLNTNANPDPQPQPQNDQSSDSQP